MRSRHVLPVLLTAVLSAGCGPQTGQPGGRASPTGRVRPVTGPTWQPLATAEPGRTVPGPLQPQPSLAGVAAAANDGTSRASAERFALHAAQLLIDVRPGITGKDVVNQIASRRLDPAVRAYLIDDIDGQHQVGTKRQYADGLDLWIRSDVLGPESAPARVDVEVVGNVTSAPMSFSHWYAIRLDVVLEDGRWRLAAYSDGHSGPTTDKNLTPAEQKSFLLGPGWRRIPSAR